MPKTFTVHIAGRDYAVQQLTVGQSRQWRQKFEQPFGEIAAALKTVSVVEITDLGGIGGILATLKTTLIGALDTVLELLCDYAPEIAADRERIEAEGYDEEVVVAFGEVLRVVFPLGVLAAMVNPSAQKPTGLPARTTSKNSVAPSMASAQATT